MRKSAAVLSCVLLFAGGALADDWPAATVQNVFSDNGSYFVRILPGQSIGKQTEIYVFEHFGGTFTFNVESGAFAYHSGQAACTPPRGPFSASWFGQ